MKLSKKSTMAAAAATDAVAASSRRALAVALGEAALVEAALQRATHARRTCESVMVVATSPTCEAAVVAVAAVRTMLVRLAKRVAAEAPAPTASGEAPLHPLAQQ